MRLIHALVLSLCACSSEPVAPPQDDPVVVKLKAGEAPDELLKDKEGKYAPEIARAIREKREWKSEADRDRAMQYFVGAAKSGCVDELFLVMEREKKAATAWGAIVMLSGQLTADHLARVEGYLTGTDDQLVGRAVLLMGEARFGGALLEKHAAKLLAKKGMGKPTLHAMGQCRARGATTAVLDYYETSSDESSLKCLGRMWEQRIDAKPLSKDDDLQRQAVYILLHHYAMGALGTKENVDAMLRVMTGAELDDFLAKHAKAAFVSRQLVASAAGAKGFEKAKGERIHDALLESPDAQLVASILWTSPYKLDAKPHLTNEKVVKGEKWPEGTKVCEIAAVRLARQNGEEADLAATAEGRAKLVERFKK